MNVIPSDIQAALSVKSSLKQIFVRFVLGNPGDIDFWNVRSSLGEAPEIDHPEQLWKAAKEYFSWVEMNPIKVERVFIYRGKSEIREINKARPMSMGGFCLFAGINRRKLAELETDGIFVDTVERIKEVISVQKFSGAVVERFNTTIIAKDIGITDRGEASGSEIDPRHQNRELSAHELALAMFNLVREGQKEQARSGADAEQMAKPGSPATSTVNQSAKTYISVDEDNGERFFIKRSDGTDCPENAS